MTSRFNLLRSDCWCPDIIDSDTGGETFACLNPAFPCINGETFDTVPDDSISDLMSDSDKVKHEVVAGLDATGIARLDATGIAGLDATGVISGTTLDGRSREHRKNIMVGLVTIANTIIITIANTITTAIGKSKDTGQYRKTCPRVSHMARGSRRQTECSVRTSDGFHNYNPGFVFSMNPGIIEDQSQIIRRISRDASMDISF